MKYIKLNLYLPFPHDLHDVRLSELTWKQRESTQAHSPDFKSRLERESLCSDGILRLSVDDVFRR